MKILSTVFFALLIAFTALAAPVTVTLVNPGSVSDGQFYDSPYELSIKQGNHTSLLWATCFSAWPADEIGTGSTWQATLMTLSQASTSGEFGGQPNSLAEYELIAVLDSLKITSIQSQIDRQHTIWNVTDPGAFAITPGMTADLAQALILEKGFNYSGVTFIEPIKGTGPYQPFVYQTSVPEPLYGGGIGLGLLVFSWIAKKRNRQ